MFNLEISLVVQEKKNEKHGKDEVDYRENTIVYHSFLFYLATDKYCHVRYEKN